MSNYYIFIKIHLCILQTGEKLPSKVSDCVWSCRDLFTSKLNHFSVHNCTEVVNL